MNKIELRQTILFHRKNGLSYNQIGILLSIPRSLVKYIEEHPNYNPTPAMAKRLNLTPTPALSYTRTRRQRLDKVARYLGYSSWSNYETLTLEFFDI